MLGFDKGAVRSECGKGSVAFSKRTGPRYLRVSVWLWPFRADFYLGMQMKDSAHQL